MNDDTASSPGEVREDIPLRPRDSIRSWGFGGVRLIVLSFTLLSIAVTIALATQIYYGDFEIVPHGSVATDSRECSGIGTDILKAGGNAVDSAIAATFCLSVVNPHNTGLDAGGIVMMYDYKQSRAVGYVPPPPIIVDFSGPKPSNLPQLVTSLAFIHEKFGQLSWDELIRPSIELARSGFSVPSTLVSAIQRVRATELFPLIEPGHNITNPTLARYLENVANTSTEYLSSEPHTSQIATKEASAFTFGELTIYTPSTLSTSTLIKLLGATLRFNQSAESFVSPEVVYRRAQSIIKTLRNTASPSPASTVAVIDKDDFYVSMITGLHLLLGSQRLAPEGYILNELPATPPTGIEVSSAFNPLIITQHYTCGQRIVLSCGEIVGAAQVIERLLADEQPASNQLVSALEGPRLRLFTTPNIAFEQSHIPKFGDVVLQTLRSIGPLTVAAEPYPTCNAVQQVKDALTSHADSRGGGIASRF